MTSVSYAQNHSSKSRRHFPTYFFSSSLHALFAFLNTKCFAMPLSCNLLYLGQRIGWRRRILSRWNRSVASHGRYWSTSFCMPNSIGYPTDSDIFSFSLVIFWILAVSNACSISHHVLNVSHYTGLSLPRKKRKKKKFAPCPAPLPKLSCSRPPMKSHSWTLRLRWNHRSSNIMTDLISENYQSLSLKLVGLWDDGESKRDSLSKFILAPLFLSTCFISSLCLSSFKPNHWSFKLNLLISTHIQREMVSKRYSSRTDASEVCLGSLC